MPLDGSHYEPPPLPVAGVRLVFDDYGKLLDAQLVIDREPVARLPLLGARMIATAGGLGQWDLSASARFTTTETIEVGS